MDANFWAIIGTGITSLGGIYAFLRNFRKDMDARFDKIDKRFVESDKRFWEMDQRVTETNKRMDGVYTILLKRIKE